MAKPPRTIEGFVKLNDITSIYRPPEPNGHAHPTSTASKTPDLIVICSWMDASQKHIAKYTTGYRHLFPSASILLIESRLAEMTWSTPDLSAALEFLGPYAQAAAAEDANRQRAMLALFSNGGATMSMLLGTALKEKYGAVPFDSLVFDCCPSHGTIQTVTKAIVFSLPNQPFVRLVGFYLVYVCVVMYAAVVETLRIENPAVRFLRILNDPGVYSTKAPRLYMYSQGDELVRPEHVQEHTKTARRVGYNVREEEFLKAPHCALVNEDSGRYWDAIKTHVLEQ